MGSSEAVLAAYRRSPMAQLLKCTACLGVMARDQGVHVRPWCQNWRWGDLCTHAEHSGHTHSGMHSARARKASTTGTHSEHALQERLPWTKQPAKARTPTKMRSTGLPACCGKARRREPGGAPAPLCGPNLFGPFVLLFFPRGCRMVLVQTSPTQTET